MATFADVSRYICGLPAVLALKRAATLPKHGREEHTGMLFQPYFRRILCLPSSEWCLLHRWCSWWLWSTLASRSPHGTPDSCPQTHNILASVLLVQRQQGALGAKQSIALQRP